MLSIVAALALAQAASPSTSQAVIDAYSGCVQRNAVAWSTGPDAARDIVAAAIARCATEENALRAEFVGDSPRNGDRVEMQKFQARSTLVDGLIEGIERRAFAAVIEARAGR